MNTNYTPEEFKQLAAAVEKIINGPEQGVIDNDTLNTLKFNVLSDLRSRGADVGGQWFEWMSRKVTK